VEVLDCCGPFEVFSAASYIATRAAQTSEQEVPTVSVCMVAEHDHPVAAHGNLMLVPHVTIASVPALDVLIVPGGDTRAVQRNPELLDWVRRVSAEAAITASVCTGAFVLAEAGLLHGKRATTHWESIDRLAQRFPDVTVERDVVWVDQGTIVTSAGISAGIDMSLHLVERLCGRSVALSTARGMEYTWREQA
jgi:transcriptional regulator GlxA family with amidase domain